jgi:hypothetical protein
MTILGFFAICLHSLSAAVQKYIVIVYYGVDNSERVKIEKAMLWIFLIFEILMAAGSIIRESTFGSMESNVPVENCYSRKTLLRFTVTSDFDCTFNANSNYLADGYFLYFMTEIYCVMKNIINQIMLSNIIEAFMYLKNFLFSKRQVIVYDHYLA